MRLLILIPAYNEEASIGDVIRRVPQVLDDSCDVSVVVINDGSTDTTADVAGALGVHVLHHEDRRGLAAAFRTGLSYALRQNAELIATLDADGQYRPEELSLLFSALQAEHADLVVGDRQVWSLAHMPLVHRVGNSIGSWMLRVLGTTGVCDASSGFRLFTRSFARSLRITSEHTYTHEMLIQASAAGVRTTEVPVTFLPRAHGSSKLVRTLHDHIVRSCGTILRSLFLYQPLRKFLILSGLCFAIAVLMVLPHAFGRSETSSFIAAGIFCIFGIQFLILGLLADAHAAERRVRIHSHDSPSS